MNRPQTGAHRRVLSIPSLALLLAVALLGGLAACTPAAVPEAAQPAATATPVVAATPEVTATPEGVDAPEAEATPTAAPAEAEDLVPEDTAALVVQLDDSRTLVRSVEVTAPISGLAVLERSDLEVVTAEFGWGTAVCSIAGAGCPADDCFCGGDIFWNYLYWDGTTWQGYGVGPATSVVSPTGAVEGWRWGEFESPMVPAPRALAAQAGLDWLQTQQVADGSFAGSIGASVEGLLAVAANGLDADSWRASPDAPSLLDYVLANGAEYSRKGVAEAGKLAVALSGAGACWPAEAMAPADHDGLAPVAQSGDAGFLAWGILGTLALGEPAPAESVAALAELALPEGGWEWSPGWGRDTNTTAVAIQTLLAAGFPPEAPEITGGLAYLQAAQVEGGGFSYDPGADGRAMADVNSTAYGLQALAAVGADPADPAWQVEGAGPVDFLLGVQAPSGAFAWQPGQDPNLLATQQAIVALLGRSYPLRAEPLSACPAAGG